MKEGDRIITTCSGGFTDVKAGQTGTIQSIFDSSRLIDVRLDNYPYEYFEDSHTFTRDEYRLVNPDFNPLTRDEIHQIISLLPESEEDLILKLNLLWKEAKDDK